ncbi:MAG: carbon-nitrogen hydrolase family protein, partial [Acidobacteria bacterium]|nr:carbon-nitrogen hydrolase family protein [Acidobacteriota bacterium]
AAETPGGRVGGLICWEHWMPLARQAMHNSGEHIHAAVWPTAHDLHHLASRHYAFEGRCFVICVGLIMPASDLPRELRRPGRTNGKLPRLVCRGGSSIFAPDGRCLAGPVFDRETILTADLDLAEIDQEKMTLDVTGHYARPDVFEFGLRRGH